MTGDRSDLYAILGLSSQATQGEIRRAYRTLMRHNHPDTRALGDHAETDATNTIARQVIAAYAVLGDPARRAVYDRSATSHAVNLFDMASKYADVGSTEEVLQILKPLRKAVAA